MTTLSPTHRLPTAEEVAIARQSGRALSAFLQTRAETQQIAIFDDKGASHPVRVPVLALRLLVDILNEIGEGNAVSIAPSHAKLTTQDAADVLKSRGRSSCSCWSAARSRSTKSARTVGSATKT